MTTIETQNAGSLNVLVLPPAGLKLLDDLAWRIGRDDCARGFLPLRCLNYRPDKARHYLDGYQAQMRQNAQRERPAGTEESR